jgi:hypothetical protein
MCEAAETALQRAGVTGDEIDLLVPHQANVRIIESTAKYAKMPMDKVFVNVDRYGNMSSASIPVALDEADRAGARGTGVAGADGGLRRRLHLGRQRGAPLMAASGSPSSSRGRARRRWGWGGPGERFPEARDVFEEADEALGFALSTLCWEGPARS